MERRIQPAIGELFDIVGNTFDRQQKHFSRHLEEMERFCGRCFKTADITGRICLDAGCGTGTASMYFATAGARQAVGFDLSRASLQVARREAAIRKIKNAKFIAGDMASFPLGDGTVDIIFSCGTLPYVSNPGYCFEEMIRVLAPKGRIVMMILRRSPFDSVYESARRILSKVPGQWKLMLAKLLALFLRLPARYFIGRQVSARQGKPLEQTLLEAFFCPAKLKKLGYEEVQELFSRKGFAISEISGISGNDFYSPLTSFVVEVFRGDKSV